MSESASTPFGYDMFEKMWGMFRNAPFAGQFPSPFGATGMGAAPSLSMMSDMVAPLTNVEELDKRIEEMRSVEQWLKLNLNMLQSAIQALEVQRATLATLRAFGAFAQSSMAAAAEAGASVTRESAKTAEPAPGSGAKHAGEPQAAAPAASHQPGSEAGAQAAASMNTAFDANGWWNLLQSQFNQIAGLAAASTEAGKVGKAGAGTAAASQAGAKAGGSRDSPAPAAKSTRAGSSPAAATPAPAAAPAAKSRAKPPAKPDAKPPKAAMRSTGGASIRVPVKPAGKTPKK